jgi:hypothetical protein
MRAAILSGPSLRDGNQQIPVYFPGVSRYLVWLITTDGSQRIPVYIPGVSRHLF